MAKKPKKTETPTEKLPERKPEKPVDTAPKAEEAPVEKPFGYDDLSATGKVIHKQITGPMVPGQGFLKEPTRLLRRIKDHEDTGADKAEIAFLRALVK